MSSRSGSPPQRPGSAPAETRTRPSWIAPADGGVVVRVHARPGASRSCVVGLHGDAIKVQVHARPVDGAANREIVRVIADALGVRAASVSIETGVHARDKRVRVAGMDLETAVAHLAPFVDKGGGAD